MISRICYIAVLTGLSWLPCTGTIIADHPADYATVTPTPGWDYLTNTLGAIGDNANYTSLFWNSTVNAYAYSATGTWGWSGRYTYLRGDRVHPGPGGAVPEYTIFAYTVQAGEGGAGTLNGFITGDDSGGASDGWDVQIYVGNTLMSASVFDWMGTPQGFASSLGSLSDGDSIYVAVGPRGDHNFDRAMIGFQIDTQVPEPSTFALLGAGSILIGLLRRRRA